MTLVYVKLTHKTSQHRSVDVVSFIVKIKGQYLGLLLYLCAHLLQSPLYPPEQSSFSQNKGPTGSSGRSVTMGLREQALQLSPAATAGTGGQGTLRWPPATEMAAASLSLPATAENTAGLPAQGPEEGKG